MDQNIHHDTTTHADRDPNADTFERQRARRAAFRDRQTQGLTRLMSERADLRGVHQLADLVDDAVRWTA